MEIRQLKYFLKVAETLNFSEASRKLYITPSTLSQQISHLEQEIGLPLFESAAAGSHQAGDQSPRLLRANWPFPRRFTAKLVVEQQMIARITKALADQKEEG